MVHEKNEGVQPPTGACPRRGQWSRKSGKTYRKISQLARAGHEIFTSLAARAGPVRPRENCFSWARKALFYGCRRNKKFAYTYIKVNKNVRNMPSNIAVSRWKLKRTWYLLRFAGYITACLHSLFGFILCTIKRYVINVRCKKNNAFVKSNSYKLKQQKSIRFTRITNRIWINHTRIEHSKFNTRKREPHFHYAVRMDRRQ